MRDWYSARELAGLPGVPTTKRRVHSRAQGEGWQFRDVPANGGTAREYHFASLPEVTRAALALREHPSSTSDQAGTGGAPSGQREKARRDSLWSAFAAKNAKAKAEAQRRVRAVHAVDALVARGSRKLDAYAAIAGELGESTSTIRRWVRMVDSLDPADHLAALAPRHVGRTVTADIDDELWELFKADYLRLEQPPASACYERVARIAQARGLSIPSCDTFERRIRREIPRAVLVLAREGAEALKRKGFPAQRRDRSVFHALEAVNADGHRWDVMVRWPDGSEARPMMVAIQDLYSGLILGWRIDRTENADAVRLAVGDVIERYGLFDHIWLDNGRAFASKWLTGGMKFRFRFKVRAEDPIGIFSALGIEAHVTTPYWGQAKPIERAFRDCCDHIAKHPAFSGAYTGNSTSTKPANYGSRAVPLEQFLEVVDQEIVAHNQRPGRRTQVCDGRSFQQAFEESYAVAPIRRATAEQRRLWLLAAEGVTCRAHDGSIHLCGNQYWSEATAELAGRKVIVRFDPQRLHEPLHVYRLDMSYVGAAACLIAAGFNDTQAAREHSRLRNANVRAARETLKRERRMTALEVAAQLPSIETPASPAAKVVRPMFGLPQSASTVAALRRDDEPDDASTDPLARFADLAKRVG